MSTHPVLIPTSLGPVGAIVDEPDGARHAALVLLQGGGRGGRAGFNSCWARIARDLAGLGIVVLRFDYWKEGDSSMITAERHRDGRGPWGGGDRDLALLREVAPWFRERAGSLDLLLVGSCYGGRLAIELAETSGDAAGAFLIVPYLRAPEQRLPWRDRLTRMLRGQAPPGRDEQLGPEILDPVAIGALKKALPHTPTLVLTGEKDPGDVFVLERLLGGPTSNLEVEVAPGVALYPVNFPDVQELVADRVGEWALAQLERLGRPRSA